jgi:triacylglycerol lipase
MTTTVLLRWLLLGEIGVHAVVVGMLAPLPEWDWVRIGALVLLLACGVRATIIGVTFAFAQIYRAPPPQACEITAGQRLAMFCRELGALFVLFSIVIPFERRRLRPDRLLRREDTRLPVLLLHGYLCNRGYWWRLAPALEAAGHQVATLSLQPAFGEVAGYVPQLARRIDEVRAATGCDQVILLGHSMGGLVARAYLQRHGGAPVAKMITLGSPHHGSQLAVLGIGPNAKQMRPGSPWLAAMTRPEQAPPCVAIYSCQDNFVMPQDSARLEGARTVALAGIGHLEMAFAPAIRRVVLEELDRGA